MSSRFNAGELSRVASMLQSKYGEVTIDEQSKNSRRFQLVRINDHGSEGSKAVLHETVRLNDVDTVATNAQQLGRKVLMGPTDNSNIGRVYVIQDPQGAVIWRSHTQTHRFSKSGSGWGGRWQRTKVAGCLRLLAPGKPHRFLNLRDDFRTRLPGDL
jgi:hypothetical protein